MTETLFDYDTEIEEILMSYSYDDAIVEDIDAENRMKERENAFKF